MLDKLFGLKSSSLDQWAKIANQRHLRAVRDGIIATLLFNYCRFFF